MTETKTGKTTETKEEAIERLKQEYLEIKAPSKPIRKRYKTNDATVEKLHELLGENPRGMLVFRDELMGMMASWEKKGHESDRAFFLEGWEGGGSYTSDRVGRGTIDTPNLCISLLGGIQPGKLTAYLNQAADPLQNDGLMQRFQLLVYPDEPDWKMVDEAPNHEARNRAFQVMEELAGMSFLAYGAEQDEEGGRPYFRFSDDAQELFYKWYEDLHINKIPNAHPLMAEHLAKYRSLMPSLALLFHLIDVADDLMKSGPVSVEAADLAIKWCEYLESHAKRIYGLVEGTPMAAARALGEKLKEGVLKDGFTLRDIYRNNWTLLNTKDQARDACDVLVKKHWLREVTEGKTRGHYLINPKLFIAND